MKRACIAIVDATRARIYTYEETSDDGGARVPPAGALHEATDLFDPGRRGHDLFSTTKPGVKRMASGGGSTDDHREAHLAELDRRFARQIIDEIDRIAREQGLERVVVVAGPAMQGVLRSAGDALERPSARSST